jgi:acetyl esterase
LNITRIFLESLQQNAGPPLYTLSPDDARAVLSGLQANTTKLQLPSEIENRIISVGSDGELLIHVVRPPGSNNETLPVVMYFHGGGWILGGFDTHERLLKELANGANAAIVYVNYTRSPEAKYPIPLRKHTLLQSGLQKMVKP